MTVARRGLKSGTLSWIDPGRLPLIAWAAAPVALVFLGCSGETETHPQDAALQDGRPHGDAPGDVGPGDSGPGDVGPGSPFSVFHRVPGGETLNAIAGWDANHFVAVGTSQVSYIFAGGKLTRLGGDVGGSDYQSVWGSSPTDVYAAGAVASGGGFVAHYDGRAWSSVFKSPTRLRGIWGTSAGGREVVMAVGEEGICYGYFPGSSWQMIQTVPVNPAAPPAAMSSRSPVLSAITGRNFNDFAITSDGAQFFHYEPDAGGLAFYRPVIDPNTNFTTAWQVPDASSTSVYIGSNFYGLYLFASQDTDASVGADAGVGYALGEVSSDPKAPGAEGLSIHGIWGTSEKILAVGDQAQIMALDISSGHIGVIAAPEGVVGTFGGVWGSSLVDIWIVGPDETLLHGSLP